MEGGWYTTLKPMPETKHYYRTLQVDPSAEPEIITAAYRRLALKYHPDSNKSPDAVRRMQEINEAYEVLSDPVKRERYNLQITGQSYRAQGSWTSAESEARRRAEAEAQRQQEPESATPQERDRKLGLSFVVVYFVILVLLLRLFMTRITSIWVVLVIFIAAGVIAMQVVWKMEEWWREGLGR